MLDELVKFFVVLLVVVEPLSLLPILAGLTEGSDDAYRRRMSVKAVAEQKGGYKAGPGGIPRNELQKIVHELDKQMKEAAKNLEFERAAALRDEMYQIKSLMAEDESLKPWERIKLLAGEED
jgi:excinuclease ABC subunit B